MFMHFTYDIDSFMDKLLILSIMLLFMSCAQSIKKDEKKGPFFSTEIANPEIKVIHNEFIKIANYYGIHFRNKVSIGFSNINEGKIIGICTYGNSFREISLDTGYWERSSWNSKVALLFHELTHCFCGRDHDFDDGIPYPDGSIKYEIRKIFSGLISENNGFMEDGCEKSIMAPIIISNRCFSAHYAYYIKEMLNRCEAW